MVTYSAVQTSNARIASCLPESVVAVFVGGTSGIGEYTLKELARAARKPRIYITGRSRTLFDRIAAECEAINRDGQYIFVQGDVSLLGYVDDLCQKVQDQEKAIDIVFWSAGTLISGQSPLLDLSPCSFKGLSFCPASQSFLFSAGEAKKLRGMLTQASRNS